MATTTLITVAPSSITAARAYVRGTDALATNGLSSSVSYGSTNTSLMTVVWTDLADGDYDVIFFIGSERPFSDVLRVDGSSAILLSDRTTAELDSDAQSMVTAFNAMRSGNVFTAPALANAPTGGGDNQEVLEAIADVTSAVAAYAARIALEVQLKGFPSVLCRNADYLEEVESEIRLTLEDVAGQEITEIAGTPVASLSWLFGAGTQTEPNLFNGTCSWDAATDELVVEIPATATAGKKLGALTWQVGVTISQKTRWLGGGTTRLIERQF
jgi:hypothetical protein